MANRRTTARDLAQIAVFAALIAALGLPGELHIGTNAVPITLQTLGVMLAGALLGARKGTLAVALFEALTFTGIPGLRFAGGRTGEVAFSSATAGYAIGFLFGAATIGALTKLILPKYPMWLALIVTAIGGIGVIYLFGTVGLLIRTPLDLGGAIAANGIYVIGDVLKVVVTVVVADQVHRSYPGLMGTTRRSTNRSGTRTRASV